MRLIKRLCKDFIFDDTILMRTNEWGLIVCVCDSHSMGGARLLPPSSSQLFLPVVFPNGDRRPTFAYQVLLIVPFGRASHAVASTERRRFFARVCGFCGGCYGRVDALFISSREVRTASAHSNRASNERF